MSKRPRKIIYPDTLGKLVLEGDYDKFAFLCDTIDIRDMEMVSGDLFPRADTFAQKALFTLLFRMLFSKNPDIYIIAFADSAYKHRAFIQMAIFRGIPVHERYIVELGQSPMTKKMFFMAVRAQGMPNDIEILAEFIRTSTIKFSELPAIAIPDNPADRTVIVRAAFSRPFGDTVAIEYLLRCGFTIDANALLMFAFTYNLYQFLENLLKEKVIMVSPEVHLRVPRFRIYDCSRLYDHVQKERYNRFSHLLREYATPGAETDIFFRRPTAGDHAYCSDHAPGVPTKTFCSLYGVDLVSFSDYKLLE